MADKTLILVGQVGRAWGITGCNKFQSYTQPQQRIREYAPWYLLDKTHLPFADTLSAAAVHVELIEIQPTCTANNSIRIAHSDSPHTAQQYVNAAIYVDSTQLQATDADEFYWHELIDKRVIHLDDSDYGRVDTLQSVGSTDVLVVVPDQQSCDNQQRMIPFIIGRYIHRVAATAIHVDWPADY